MATPTRTTNIYFMPDDFAAITEIAGHEKLMSAIGYLATWNITGFPVVTITRDRHDTADLFASYRDPDHPERRYSIGAVWHDDHYGFHS